jgi:hypothetical protein
MRGDLLDDPSTITAAAFSRLNVAARLRDIT